MANLNVDGIIKANNHKVDLLWSGSYSTNSGTITLDVNVTDYDLLLFCGHAWSNSGFILPVGTTSLQPTYTDNYTGNSYHNSVTGKGGGGTTFFVSVRIDNSTNVVTYYTGYDSTNASNNAYLQRIYGIKFLGE